MKLGEALTLRARQAQRLNDLTGRIKAASMAQEGETPAENVRQLIDDYLGLSDAHAALVARITRTNLLTDVPAAGSSLLELIQTRERMIRQRNIYGIVARAATSTPQDFRYMRTEIKFVPQVNVAEIRGYEDHTQAEITVLDAQIQQVNWETDLLT